MHENGQSDWALESYKTALEINPNSADVFYNLGNLQQDMGDLDLAIASFTTATTFNPYYVQAYNNAGNAKHLAGDLDGAIDSFIHAITVETGTHESKRRLAIHLSYGLPRRELFHPIISAHR